MLSWDDPVRQAPWWKIARDGLAFLSRCDCERPFRGLTCRCTCDLCGSHDLHWKSWGSYLDRDLICWACGATQDTWDC